MHESVAQNILLDPRDYAFETPSTKTRKRNVTVTQDDDSSDDKFDERERRRLAKNLREAVRRQRRREEAAQAAQSSTPPKKKKTVSKDINIPPIAHSGPPSPTPPLDHTREAVGNNFKFTDSERAYAIQYAQVLFARDHEISSIAIGTALHNKVGYPYFIIINARYLSFGKMPHHSVGSWRTHIGSASVRDEIDRLRKRAGIVFRKNQEQKQPQVTQSAPDLQDKSESEPEGAVVTPITPSPTLVDEFDADKKLAEEDDLNTAAKFFAASEDNNENEAVIWARLTSQVLFPYTFPFCAYRSFCRRRARPQLLGRNFTTHTMKKL